MLTAAARTHVGRVRAQNEDAAVCRVEHGLFAVIDGMGGQEAGEVAAAIAAQVLAELPNEPSVASEIVLAAAFREARDRILRHGDTTPAHREMGAVATAARLDDDGRHVTIAHVGDTRAWVLTPKGARQLTRDHVEGAAGGKAQVTRDLGRRVMSGDWVDTTRHAVGPGDYLVLASDGLYDPVPASELAAAFDTIRRERSTPDAAASRLVSLALLHGGPDNVTVVVARVGAFHRGDRPRRRLPPTATMAVFVALVAVVALVAWRWAPTREPTTLPDVVARSTSFDAAEARLAPGATLRVRAGVAYELRGVDVTGDDLRIELEDGATLTLRRSVLRVDGLLEARLGRGARLVLEDTRVEGAEISLTGAEGSRLALDHALLSASAPPRVDPVIHREDGIDVRILPPTPSSPADAPLDAAPEEAP